MILVRAQLIYISYQQGTPRAPDFELRVKLKRLEWIGQLVGYYFHAFRFI
jgi:hypothetical protein